MGEQRGRGRFECLNQVHYSLCRGLIKKEKKSYAVTLCRKNDFFKNHHSNDTWIITVKKNLESNYLQGVYICYHRSLESKSR